MRSLQRLLGVLSLLVAVAIGATGEASALISQYTYTVTTGSAKDMSGATSTSVSDDQAWGINPIGFTFNFNGTDYTQFSMSSNGLFGFGSSIITTAYGNAGASPNIAAIMPFWDDLYPPNTLSYVTTGASPNRVLTAQWDSRHISDGNAQVRVQVRLYETSNKIEIYYDQTNSSSAWSGTVGLWQSGSDFAHITTSTGGISYSTRSESNAPPSSGTMYVFSLCEYFLVGAPAQGGPSAMTDGDSLLRNVTSYRGVPVSRKPFTINNSGAACGVSGATYTITGPNAADYSISPNPEGFPGEPTIVFTPSGIGTRNANLRIVSGTFVRNYPLAGIGLPGLTMRGLTAGGGTDPLRPGDTLMRNIAIPPGQCVTAQPVVIKNDAAIPLSYTVTSPDPQYMPTPPSGTLNPGDSVVYNITFCPADTGWRVAPITFQLDAVTQNYTLMAKGAFPDAQFAADGIGVDSTTEVFNMKFGCVGEEFVTIPLDVTAASGMPFTIHTIHAFEVDTTIRQGTPAYELRHDQFGNLVPAGDYIITTTPPSLPFTSATAVPLPYTVPVGTTRMYLSFIANRPGKRFARVYIQTDALNLHMADPYGMPTLGLLHFDVYGRGRAAMLSDGGTMTQLPRAVDFGVVRLGDRITRWVPISNRGECPMTIDIRYLRTDVGDVDELKMEMPSPTFALSADSNFLMLPPGGTDSLLLSFAPKQIGSRRAGLYLRTNDSALTTPGTPEHGVYRMELLGKGASGLYLTMEGGHIGSGIIGDATGPYAHGVVRMVNNSDAPINVTALAFSGMDSADFQQAPAWPGLPFDIAPGQIIELGVDFKPVAGMPGLRQTTVLATTSTAQTIGALVTANAGARTITVNPSAVVFPTAKAGRIVRQTVMVQNTGSVPVTIMSVSISGTDAADFKVAPLPRWELAPGQAEFLEVSYSRATAGASTASLDIMTTASATPTQVSLTAAAVMTRYKDDDPSSAVIGQSGRDLPENGGVEFGVAGVSTEQKGSINVVPNPARGGEVEVGYAMAGAHSVEVVVIDGAGRLMGSQQVNGAQGSVKVSTAGLAAGVYTIQVRSEGGVVSQRLVVLP